MPRLENVNTTDLIDAIALGCRTMQSVFDADDNDIPFFNARVMPRRSHPETFLAFSRVHSEAHTPGRHLNALLNAEDAAGIELDEAAVEKHARATFLAFTGPLDLPLNRLEKHGPVNHFLPHNCREAMHALTALVRYRRSEPAREMAERMIEAVCTLWRPDRRWDEQVIREQGIRIRDAGGFILGEARLIGPLVKYHNATGYGPALDLALRLKEKAVAEFFLEDGSYDPARFFTHTHSTTCTMSSLAQLADLLGDTLLMERVRAFYDNGLWQIRDEMGWVIEGDRPEKNPDNGELNNTGDIVETALILGRWGHTRCFHDVECILRGYLLPSQLRDNAFIVDPPNPHQEDGRRNIADRLLGSFGFAAPYGHQPLGREMINFNTDVVGGVVGSLCEVLREATRLDRAGHRVNLLFDHETDAIRVQSPYTHGQLSVTVKKPSLLFVRIPPWVDPAGIVVTGADEVPTHTNGYLFLAEPPIGTPIAIDFDVTPRQLVLKHRTRDIRVRLRGDQVVAMDNFGADLTFFEPFE